MVLPQQQGSGYPGPYPFSQPWQYHRWQHGQYQHQNQRGPTKWQPRQHQPNEAKQQYQPIEHRLLSQERIEKERELEELRFAAAFAKQTRKFPCQTLYEFSTRIQEAESTAVKQMKFVYFEDFLTLYERRYLFRYLNDLLPQFVQDSASLRWVYSWSVNGLSYNYNGQRHVGKPIPPFLQKILEKIKELCGHDITHILANYYEDGGVGVPHHSDNERGVRPGSTIATISLGATRLFNIQVTVMDHAGKPVPGASFPVRDGSMSFMTQDFQGMAKHAIMKNRRPTGPRFSLTFRWVENEVSLRLSPIFNPFPSPIIQYIRWLAEETLCRRFTKDKVEGHQISTEDFVFIEEKEISERMITILMTSRCVATIVYYQDTLRQAVEDHIIYKMSIPSWQSKSLTIIVDFRSSRSEGRDVWTLDVPSSPECIARLQSPPERKVLPMYTGPFDASLPKQPLNIKRFCELALSLPLNLGPKLILSVVEEVKNNCFSVKFKGGSEWTLDCSQEFLEHKEQLEEQITEDIKCGRVIGPFSRSPFPNKYCPQQPRINLIFSVPKNKYDTSDPRRRMIFHFSHPRFRSKNHLTPRDDSGLEYDTVRKILLRVAQLGRGTRLFLADVKSAYKLLNVRREEWFLQNFRIGDKYYVGKVGMLEMSRRITGIRAY